MTRAWQQEQEKGTQALRRFVVWFALVCGRRLLGALLACIVFYYVLFAPRARRASSLYLRRVLNRPVGFWDNYRHFLHFAKVATDRFYFLHGKLDYFAFELNQAELFDQFTQGGILVTAHLGSFEALRALAKTHRQFRLRLVLDVQHNAHVVSMLSEVDPDLARDIIDARLPAPALALALQEAVDAGHWVGIMGDRLAQNDRAYSRDFLGDTARFPEGLWQLASILKCPVIACAGLYTQPNRYRLEFALISASLAAPRSERAQVIAQSQTNYVNFLAERARLYPYNWFNFYDFWQV